MRAAARKLGYVAGRPRSTGAVAVVSAPLDNPFYPALVGPLQEALARQDTQFVDALRDKDLIVQQRADVTLSDGAEICAKRLRDRGREAVPLA